MAHFYCRKLCGDPEFSIDEWNKAYQYCIDAGLTEAQMNEILHPELDPCTQQCFVCMADVGERRLKTKQHDTSIRFTPR